MNPSVRLIIALAAGILTAFLSIALIETIGHTVFPAPTGLDYNNPDALNAYVAALPLGAKLFVLAAWLIGTIDGVFVACLINRNRYGLCAGVIAGLVMLATSVNLYLIPHPGWLAAAGLIGIPLAAFLTAELSRRIIRPRAASHD